MWWIDFYANGNSATFFIALVVSRFQKKPRVLLATKMSQEIFFEYRLMAQ